MDNMHNITSPDNRLINLTENYEVEYWANKFKVNREALQKAVAAVGTRAVEVEKYLS